MLSTHLVSLLGVLRYQTPRNTKSERNRKRTTRQLVTAARARALETKMRWWRSVTCVTVRPASSSLQLARAALETKNIHVPDAAAPDRDRPGTWLSPPSTLLNRMSSAIVGRYGFTTDRESLSLPSPITNLAEPPEQYRYIPIPIPIPEQPNTTGNQIADAAAIPTRRRCRRGCGPGAAPCVEAARCPRSRRCSRPLRCSRAARPCRGRLRRRRSRR